MTIGMPVYNAERYLPVALDSILNQTYQNIEFIISDNASTDSTLKICLEYERRDSRIRVIQQKENLGAARNFNLVGRLARGKYFKWAAGNDICDPRLVEACVNALEERHDCVLAYPEAYLIDANADILAEYEDPLDVSDDDAAQRFLSVLSTLGLNNAQHGLIRSDALLQTGFMGIYTGGDIPFVAELALHGKFLRLPDRLFMRRVSPDASTIGKDISAHREFNQIRGSVLATNPDIQFWLHILRVIGKSDQPVSVKAGLYRLLPKRMWWKLSNILEKELFHTRA